MKTFRVRKYSYVILWLALFAAVAGVWFLRGKVVPEKEETASSQGEVQPVTEETGEEGEPLVGVWVPYFSLSTQEGTQEAFEANYREMRKQLRKRGSTPCLSMSVPFPMPFTLRKPIPGPISSPVRRARIRVLILSNS